jgi:hypothetical protein
LIGKRKLPSLEELKDGFQVETETLTVERGKTHHGEEMKYYYFQKLCPHDPKYQ